MADSQKPDGEKTAPPPDARYEPATTDGRVMIRFVGNSAQVGALSFIGPVDPFQLLAAAEYLKYTALNSIRAVEAQTARMAIAPATTEQVAKAAGILRTR